MRTALFVTRARELARNECPGRLKDKVERAEGRDISFLRRPF
jgi:hypothetical protein